MVIRWIAIATIIMLAACMSGGIASAEEIAMPCPAIPPSHCRPLVNPRQVYSYQRLLRDVDALQKRYPDLIEIHDIGASVEGRRIIALKVGHGPVEVALNGAHHAREWITSALLMNMVDAYALAYARGEMIGPYDVHTLLERATLWVIPMVNPDGVSLVQSGAKSANSPATAIRLNRRSRNFTAWKANARGVDLNRQYPAGWETIDDPAPRPGPSNYQGTAPLTEPEAHAMRDFTLAHKGIIQAAFHSSGQIIFWHYYQQGDLLRDSSAIARRLQRSTGYKLVPPSEYESGGGFKDWVITTQRVPAFTIEVAPFAGQRPVPLSSYSGIWARLGDSGLFLLHEALLYKDGLARDGKLYEICLDGRIIAGEQTREAARDKLRAMLASGIGRQGYLREHWSGLVSDCMPETTTFRILLEGGETRYFATCEEAKTALRDSIAAADDAWGWVLSSRGDYLAGQGTTPERCVSLQFGKNIVKVDAEEIQLAAPVVDSPAGAFAPGEFFEKALGVAIREDVATGAITLRRGKAHVDCLLGSRLVRLDERVFRMPCAPFKRECRLYLPLRALAISLGYAPAWDGKTATLTLHGFVPSVAEVRHDSFIPDVADDAIVVK